MECDKSLEQATKLSLHKNSRRLMTQNNCARFVIKSFGHSSEVQITSRQKACCTEVCPRSPKLQGPRACLRQGTQDTLEGTQPLTSEAAGQLAAPASTPS